MNNPDLIKNYVAAVAVSTFQIVKFGSTDDSVVPATAGTAIGVSADASAAPGERVDIVMTGATPVRYGATVTRGDRLTSDANGAAIPLTEGAQSVGIALLSGVAGDIGSVLLCR